jgi:glutamate--cysteine ligase
MFPMPESDPSEPVGLDQARARIAAVAFPRRASHSSPGQVGLEPEIFAFRISAGGHPVRLPLAGPNSVLETIDAMIAAGELDARSEPGTTPVYTLPNSGRLTFEPAGQIEHSTAIFATAAAALDDVETTARHLDDGFAKRGARLAALGIDLWNSVDDVPQQLGAARYLSMAAYFAARGPQGAVMMRNTGSIQVNLDLGPPGIDAERWLLSNLLSPLATASFACSPLEGAVSRRAQAWQGLDPTRTGFPARLIAEGLGDPGEQYAEFALDADVMLFRRGPDGGVPGRPGLRFRDWIANGHPVHGPATVLDLDYHLSTLFPEVRLRGFFELRAVDGVPAHWRPAVVVFWTGLLYDDAARRECLALLEPSRGELQEFWLRSARNGLGDPELAALARSVWALALEGAERLPAGFLRTGDLARADEFRRRYVAGDRSLADELTEALAIGPSEALAFGVAADVVVDSE